MATRNADRLQATGAGFVAAPMRPPITGTARGTDGGVRLGHRPRESYFGHLLTGQQLEAMGVDVPDSQLRGGI